MDINNTPSGILNYYKEAQTVDLLPNDVVCDLVRKAKTGDITARNRVIRHNLKLVMAMAMRSQHTSILDIEDRIQWGNLGLLHAVEKYDPDMVNPETGKPFQFSTYATWWIKQSMDREGKNTQSTIRLPIHVTRSMAAVKRIQRKLYLRGIHDPKPSDYAEYFDEDFTPKDLRTFELVPYTYSENILATVDAEEVSSIFDTVEDESLMTLEDTVDRELLKTAISQCLDSLNDSERTVIMLRFGLGEDCNELTLDDVGKILERTRERVRQIQVKAISKMKIQLLRILKQRVY